MAKKREGLDANPIPWQEFVAGYRVAMEAIMGGDGPPVVEAETKSDAASVLARTDAVEGANGPADASGVQGEVPEALRERLEKDPYARVLFSLRSHFGPKYPNYRPLIYRFWGLYDLVHRGQLPEWVTPAEDGTMGLHPALLLAAADVKLTKKGKLPPDRFRERVRDIIAREMADAAQSDGLSRSGT